MNGSVFLITAFSNGSLYESVRDRLKEAHDISLSHDWYAECLGVKNEAIEICEQRLIADIAGLGRASVAAALFPKGYDSFIEIGVALGNPSVKQMLVVLWRSDAKKMDIGYFAHPKINLLVLDNCGNAESIVAIIAQFIAGVCRGVSYE